MVEGFPSRSAHINPELPPLLTQHSTVAGMVAGRWGYHNTLSSP